MTPIRSRRPPNGRTRTSAVVGGTTGGPTVKILDVAKAAQVSAATVSRVLNNSARVDPVLGARVRDAAERLGYRPNAVARNLRRQGTLVWALIITDINNPFYTALARGVEDYAQERGYSVLLCNTDEDQSKEDRYLEVAAQERVAGVILAPRASTSDISSLFSSGIPLVAVDRKLNQPVDFVTAASFEGAVLATEHLLRQGWTRPACITRPADTATTEERRLGYREVVRRHSLAEIVRHVPFHSNEADEVVEALLDSETPPDSFLTVDSMLSLAILAGLKRRRVRVGRDVGLIGFDDSAWAPIVEPSLSVIAQPAYEMGMVAAQLLFDRIQNRSSMDRQVMILNTTMIIRGSSRRQRTRERKPSS